MNKKYLTHSILNWVIFYKKGYNNFIVTCTHLLKY